MKVQLGDILAGVARRRLEKYYQPPVDQRAVRWVFRILYGWIALALAAMAVMFVADFLNLV